MSKARGGEMSVIKQGIRPTNSTIFDAKAFLCRVVFAQTSCQESLQADASQTCGKRGIHQRTDN